jgi:hypothetical protein
MWKMPGWLTKVGSRLLATTVAADVAEETKWAESYKPVGNEDVYVLISKYAEQQYDSLVNHFDNADKKADEHLHFMTAAMGAVIALTASKLVRVELPYLTVVGGFLDLLAFDVAAMVKPPAANVFPMTPRALLAVADFDAKLGKHQIECAIVACPISP